jgi:hypothetical protein
MADEPRRPHSDGGGGGNATAPNSRELLEAALSYAALGWQVLPLEPGAKKPLVPTWQATATAAAVRAWWEQWPLANVGVATGRRSGLVVVEVDDDAMEDVAAQFPELLKATVRARTGDGKQQFYFAYHRGRQLRSGRLAAGAVAYADGGYVVAPPSRLCDCWCCLLARRAARRERR